MEIDTDVILAGKIRKKKSRGNAWSDRYLKLKHQLLEYYTISGAENVRDYIPYDCSKLPKIFLLI